MTQAAEKRQTRLQRILDVVERTGNKVPHPAVLFLALMAVVIVLSHALSNYSSVVALNPWGVFNAPHRFRTTTDSNSRVSPPIAKRTNPNPYDRTYVSTSGSRQVRTTGTNIDLPESSLNSFPWDLGVTA